ncbi:hypothetical protein AB0K48_45945 [Nonomuraea sp. NPDC055795]
MPATPNVPAKPDRQHGFSPEFKPKNDADYEQFNRGGLIRKGRTHETLVSEYGQYLAHVGFVPATNVHP